MRFLPVLLLLFLAALLFTDGIADRAIWVDEGYSIAASQRDSISDILEFTRRDNHPPLYPILLHGWGKLVGAHPFGLRVLGLGAGLLTIALTYRLGLDWFNPRAAFAAGIITASSDLLIGMTPLVRQYNLYLLLAVLATWAYSRYTQTWRWQWGVVYALSGLGLLYTLYWGAFILLAHGLHFLICYPRRLPWILAPAAVIAIGYLPWLPRLKDTLSGSGYTMSASGHLSALAVDSVGLRIIAYQLFGVPEMLFLGFTIAGIFVFANPSSESPPHAWGGGRRWGGFSSLPLTRHSLLAALWLAIPVLLPMLITAAGYKMLTHFPMIALIPAMGLLIGHLFGQMERWIYGVLLLSLLANNLLTIGSDFRERGPWWEVADTLAAYSNPQTALLMEADYHAYALEEHAHLVDMPAAQVIRAQQIRDRWSGEPDVPVNDLIMEQAAVWLFEFIPGRDLRVDLANLGYQATTPPLDFGVFLGRPISLQRFALPISADPIATIGDHLVLAESQYFQQNGTLSVDLTWTVTAQPEIDYTVSVFLLNPNGTLAVQHDSYPLDGKSPTGGWQPGQFYFDPHNLPISALPPGTYPLAIKVYTWQDGRVYPPDPCNTESCEYLIVGEVELGTE